MKLSHDKLFGHLTSNTINTSKFRHVSTKENFMRELCLTNHLLISIHI